MQIICSWCKKFMGEKEPFDDPSETHAKCAECLKKQSNHWDSPSYWSYLNEKALCTTKIAFGFVRLGPIYFITSVLFYSHWPPKKPLFFQNRRYASFAWRSLEIWSFTRCKEKKIRWYPRNHQLQGSNAFCGWSILWTNPYVSPMGHKIFGVS